MLDPLAAAAASRIYRSEGPVAGASAAHARAAGMALPAVGGGGARGGGAAAAPAAARASASSAAAAESERSRAAAALAEEREALNAAHRRRMAELDGACGGWQRTCSS